MQGTCVAMLAKPVTHATFSVFFFLVFLTPAVDNMQSSELEKQPSCSKQLRPALSNKPIAGVGRKKQNVWVEWPQKTIQPFLLQHQKAGGGKTFSTKPHAQSWNSAAHQKNRALSMPVSDPSPDRIRALSQFHNGAIASGVGNTTGYITPFRMHKDRSVPTRVRLNCNPLEQHNVHGSHTT